MKNVIHHIRKQPEHVRRSILFVSTAFLGVVLICLWVYSLGTTFTNQETQAKISQDIKPFSAIKDNMVNGYNSISDPSTNTTTNTDSNSDLRNQENNL